VGGCRSDKSSSRRSCKHRNARKLPVSATQILSHRVYPGRHIVPPPFVWKFGSSNLHRAIVISPRGPHEGTALQPDLFAILVRAISTMWMFSAFRFWRCIPGVRVSSSHPCSCPMCHPTLACISKPLCGVTPLMSMGDGASTSSSLAWVWWGHYVQNRSNCPVFGMNATCKLSEQLADYARLGAISFLDVMASKRTADYHYDYCAKLLSIPHRQQRCKQSLQKSSPRGFDSIVRVLGSDVTYSRACGYGV